MKKKKQIRCDGQQSSGGEGGSSQKFEISSPVIFQLEFGQHGILLGTMQELERPQYLSIPDQSRDLRHGPYW